MMPDLDGWSVLAALRQDAELAEIPVIMVTILDEPRRAVALGAAGYLSKPIDRDRLRRLVGRFRSPARPTRILLVEDDESQRDRVRSWLADQEWVVQEATNGREALARMREYRPDMILLDLMMPEMDGFAVVAALQTGAGLAGHSRHRDHCARSRAKGPRTAEFRRAFGIGQEHVPAGRTGRTHPPARARRAGSRHWDGNRVVIKVLYIEDNDDNVYMLKMRLELLGDFEVLAAEDGEKGCEMAAAERPDVILMDLEMPVIDGWEATRRLKGNPQTSDIPVIALSAHALAGAREKALAAGCDEFDTKPIEFERLVGTLRRVLAGRV